MHGGPLEDVKVQGDSLRFRVQAGDADLIFTGQLRGAKLTGILEATANGRHGVSGPKGKKVGEGTWVMSRVQARTRPSTYRQQRA